MGGSAKTNSSGSSKQIGAPEDDTVVTHGPKWFLLRGALALEEQIRLFGFILECDATDWEALSPCMDPTPKTLELAHRQGSQAAPTLSLCADDGTAVVEMVAKAIGILRWRQAIKSLTVAAIRYCASGSHPCIGGCFPPHVDHCNDGSWVFLFSIGRTATFHIQCPGMDQRHTFEMKSGDALVFDPSSEAAIVHGVASIACDGEASARVDGFASRFEVLRSSRFGVQCRVSLVE